LLAVWVAIAAGGSGCGRVVMNQPVYRAGDAWEVTLRKLTDGPNQWSANPHSVLVPGRERRFIWAHITLHNNQPVARKFNFDRCGLDDGDSQVVPAKIDIDAIITDEVNREPELSPDETITRKLIFVYPENRSPTQLTCLPMVIPLPQF